jgi:dephospho-CoA kinase
MILGKQMPDAQKRERADFIIETKSLDYVRDAVHTLIKKILGQNPNA